MKEQLNGVSKAISNLAQNIEKDVTNEEEYGKEVPADWGQYQFESTLENFEHRIKEPDWYRIGAIYNEIHNSECKCIDCKTKRWKV